MYANMCSLKVLEVLKQMEQAKYDPSIFYTSVQELLDHYPEFVFNEKVRGTTDVWHDLEKKVTPIYHKNSLNYNIVDLMPLIANELEHLLRVRNLIRKILCVATAYRNKALFLQIIEHELKIELNTGGGISPAVRRVVIIYEKEGHVSAKKRKVPNNSENGDDVSVVGKKKEMKDPSSGWPKSFPTFPKKTLKPPQYPIPGLGMPALTTSLSEEDLLVLDAICNLKHVGAWEKDEKTAAALSALSGAALGAGTGGGGGAVVGGGSVGGLKKETMDPEEDDSSPYDKVYYTDKKSVGLATIATGSGGGDSGSKFSGVGSIANASGGCNSIVVGSSGATGTAIAATAGGVVSSTNSSVSVKSEFALGGHFGGLNIKPSASDILC